MRIERVQASPHKKGRVLVFLEDGACLKITEQEALDFGLRTGDDLDGRRLEQLKKAASAGLGYGPARIREKLREKGVPRELWDEALDQAPDSAWQIDRFLAAKLRGRAPEEAEKRRLTSALLRRGFAWGDVREAWSRLGAEILEE